MADSRKLYIKAIQGVGYETCSEPAGARLTAASEEEKVNATWIIEIPDTDIHGEYIATPVPAPPPLALEANLAPEANDDNPIAT